jgi:hypothetical protein
MHPNQLTVKIGTVRALVAEQFPAWAKLPVQAVAPRGTVNALFRIGDRLAARSRSSRARPLRWIGGLSQKRRQPVSWPRAPSPGPYCADMPNPLDRALGVPDDPYGHDTSYARYQALQARAAQAITAENWPAAQTYALLLIAEQMNETSASNVMLANWEDLATAIAASLSPRLEEIAQAIR